MPISDRLECNCSVSVRRTIFAEGIDRASAQSVEVANFRAFLTEVGNPGLRENLKIDGSSLHGKLLKGWAEKDDLLANINVEDGQEMVIRFDYGPARDFNGSYIHRHIDRTLLKRTQGINEELLIRYEDQ